PYSPGQRIDLLLERLEVGVAAKGLPVGGKRLLRLAEGFVSGPEVGVGHRVVGGLGDGLAVRLESLTVAALLVVDQAEVVVGVGVPRAEGNGAEVLGFGLGMGSRGSICQSEEQMGVAMVGL